MKKLVVLVGKTENNFSACIEGLDGFVCTATTVEELKKEVVEGLEFHLNGLIEDNDPIPELLKEEYQLEYKWDVESLFYYYNGIFTKSAMEKLTGINQRQLGHYATGHSRPRPQQIEKIQKALRRLGSELMEINL